MAKKSELESAYRATTYRLMLPETDCDLRIDVPSVCLAGWMCRKEFDTFSLLTAYNPASRLCSELENIERQRALLADVEQAGCMFVTGRNEADLEGWPVELSVCVFDLSLAEACGLGLKYGQNAWLGGGRDGVPHLYWIKEIL